MNRNGTRRKFIDYAEQQQRGLTTYGALRVVAQDGSEPKFEQATDAVRTPWNADGQAIGALWRWPAMYIVPLMHIRWNDQAHKAIKAVPDETQNGTDCC